MNPVGVIRATVVFMLLVGVTSPSLVAWQSPGQLPADSTGPVPDPSPRFVPGPDYVIGLGDSLRISVWKEPEVSATVQVRTDGKISLPLLNEIPAVGLKPMDLAAVLTEKLKKYVEDPRVTIVVLGAKPPVAYMVGQVGHPGAIALSPNMTVLQALLNSSPTLFANTKKIYVLRTENGVQHKFKVNYKRMIKGKSANDNIILKPGDMIVVP